MFRLSFLTQSLKPALRYRRWRPVFCEKNLRVSSGLAGLLKSPNKKSFWKVGPRVIMPQNLITCDSLVLPDQLLCFAYFVSGVITGSPQGGPSAGLYVNGVGWG